MPPMSTPLKPVKTPPSHILGARACVVEPAQTFAELRQKARSDGWLEPAPGSFEWVGWARWQERIEQLRAKRTNFRCNPLAH